MNANGAPDVQAVNVLNSGNHGTCVIPAFTAAYYFFDGLSEGCTFISDVSQFQEREAPKMFPNPVSSHLNVNTGTESGIFALFTSEGRKVMETKVGGGMNTLDLSQLPAGTYIAVVDSDKGWFRELVIIAP